MKLVLCPPPVCKKDGLLLAGAGVETALGKALPGELNQKGSKLVFGDVHSVKQQNGDNSNHNLVFSVDF